MTIIIMDIPPPCVGDLVEVLATIESDDKNACKQLAKGLKGRVVKLREGGSSETFSRVCVIFGPEGGEHWVRQQDYKFLNVMEDDKERTRAQMPAVRSEREGLADLTAGMQIRALEDVANFDNAFFIEGGTDGIVEKIDEDGDAKIKWDAVNGILSHKPEVWSKLQIMETPQLMAGMKVRALEKAPCIMQGSNKHVAKQHNAVQKGSMWTVKESCLDDAHGEHALLGGSSIRLVQKSEWCKFEIVHDYRVQKHLEIVPKSSKTWQALCKMFSVQDPWNLGVGGDVEEKSGKYNALCPVYAWRIISGEREALYNTALDKVVGNLQAVKQSIGQTQIQTSLTDLEILQAFGRHGNGNVMQEVERKMSSKHHGDDDSMGDVIQDKSAGVCETFLLHGTKPQYIRTVISRGLRAEHSDGLFGKGISLAERASKIDQHCTMDPGPAGADAENGLAALHEELYVTNGVNHPGPVYYAFVCRAALGLPVYTKDGKSNMHPPYNPLFASKDKRDLAAVPGSHPKVHYHTLITEPGPEGSDCMLKRNREFVVFDSNRILEEYLVAYKRELDPTVSVPVTSSRVLI